MPYLTDLATVARRTGYKVVEVNGWKTRGHGPMVAVQSVIAHHTATSRKAEGSYPSLNIVTNGYAGLPGPLSHFGLGRDGTIYVIAAGRCYHAGVARALRFTNSYAIGIEAENDGVGEPWPKAQMDAYHKLCAELVKHYGLTVSDVQGHKEIAVPAGRKADPNFDMDTFRSNVTKARSGGSTSSPAPSQPGTAPNQPVTAPEAGFYRATEAASLHTEPNSKSLKVRDVERGDLLLVSSGARHTQWWVQVGDYWVQRTRIRTGPGSADAGGHHGEYPDRALPVNGSGTRELEKAWKELFLRIGWWKGDVQSSMFQYFGHLGYKGSTIARLQAYLRDRGFYSMRVDGIRGPGTITGEKSFLNGQREHFTPRPVSHHSRNRAYSGKVY